MGLESYNFPKACVLLLGNEQNGVPSRLLELVDVCVEVGGMAGPKENFTAGIPDLGMDCKVTHPHTVNHIAFISLWRHRH